MEDIFPLPLALLHCFIADSLQLEVSLSGCGGSRWVVHVRTVVLEVGPVRVGVLALGVGHVLAGVLTARCAKWGWDQVSKLPVVTIHTFPTYFFLIFQVCSMLRPDRVIEIYLPFR